MAPNRSIFAAIDGIDCIIPDAEQPHGVAQILFLSQEDQKTFGTSSPITQFIHKDEQNLCDRNVTVSSIDGDAQTYIDQTGEETPNRLSPNSQLVKFFSHHSCICLSSWLNSLVLHPVETIEKKSKDFSRKL
ncbi:hypothetical protein F7734_01475 [Scytonema sp. UIC 10036]|uniref:hypothetical protein n=1 Tax=Scytonema sp. UIC 10036 TaxID=2304196 RepID=UPI0012DA6634|nr:hypothetical protein [Scytonema sp. UIC 10036]MUG91234.1 hypothetical protein [Scytonema sp. UIC 10036]